MSKIKFFLSFFFIITILGGELYYLNSRPKSTETLKNFVKFTNFFSVAFYSNTPYLRHQDRNNIDSIFATHPALRERKVGTFVNSLRVAR